MTDREKIMAVADAFELDYEEKGRSLVMGGRKFFFNEAKLIKPLKYIYMI